MTLDHYDNTYKPVPACVDWSETGNDFIVGESLDDAAREAIERANGGPVFLGIDYSSDYLDEQALMRVIGKITIGEGDLSAFAIVNSVSLRQSATETPADFVKRIALALLKEMAGVE